MEEKRGVLTPANRAPGVADEIVQRLDGPRLPESSGGVLARCLTALREESSAARQQLRQRHAAHVIHVQYLREVVPALCDVGEALLGSGRHRVAGLQKRGAKRRGH